VSDGLLILCQCNLSGNKRLEQVGSLRYHLARLTNVIDTHVSKHSSLSINPKSPTRDLLGVAWKTYKCDGNLI
jgi:hypothetical protein